MPGHGWQLIYSKQLCTGQHRYSVDASWSVPDGAAPVHVCITRRIRLRPCATVCGLLSNYTCLFMMLQSSDPSVRSVVCVRKGWGQLVIWLAGVYAFRFRFNRIVARRRKISKFTANRKKTTGQCNNAIQTYCRLWCSPEFWVAAGPVVLVTSIQQTYHNRTTKHTYSVHKRQRGTKLKC